MLKYDGNLLDWFEESCHGYPSHTAIETVDRAVSYRQLQGRVEKLDELLEHIQLGSGDVAAVMVLDRIDLIATMISLFKRGALFVPLDADGPAARTKAMLSNAHPAVLLTDGSLEGDVASVDKRYGIPCPRVDIRHESLDNLRPVSKKPTRFIPLCDRAADAPAYIYYTSGSTGKPNGVVGRLDAVSQFIAWEAHTFSVERGWRVSQLSQPTFDPFLRDVFLAICTGGTVVIPPYATGRMTPEELTEWITDSNIQIVHTVPTIVSALADSDRSAGNLSGLRYLFVAGETLYSSAVRQFRERFGSSVPVINLYGSTETTMVKLFHMVQESDLEKPAIPIGQAMDGTEVLVLDKNDRLCSLGEIGEICIRSPYLALGYHRNPDLTAKAFTPDPFFTKPGTVLYRTGDNGRQRSDGTLEFLERRDDLVKVRGVRIELGEVKAALEANPVVSEAALIAEKEGENQKRVVAYTVIDSADPISVADVRVHLCEILPREMLPSEIVFVDSIPKTANGKIDRQKLASLSGGRCPRRADSTPAGTELEVQLESIWCEVLGLGSVGMNENFLDLGGHSISVMRIAARYEKLTGKRMPISAIFDHPTIAGLAQYLSASAKQADPIPSRHARVQVDQARNLVIVVNEQLGRPSFELLARNVESVDASIRAFVVDDAPMMPVDLEDRPTLVFCPAMLRNRPVFRGHIVCGKPLSKSEEYEALAAKDISVPAWKLFTGQNDPDLSSFAPWVVCKPNEGGKGAAVKLIPASRAAWKPVFTAAGGLSDSFLIQEFIYTGPRACSYRVTTLFGKTLYAVSMKAGPGRPQLMAPEEIGRGNKPAGLAIVSNTPDSEIEPIEDHDIIALAEAASTAFSDIPLLGVDILREARTGKLYVIEVNSIGYNWNFPGSGPRSFDFPIENQFDGLGKAARILAEKTRALAAAPISRS